MGNEFIINHIYPASVLHIVRELETENNLDYTVLERANRFYLIQQIGLFFISVLFLFLFFFFDQMSSLTHIFITGGFVTFFTVYPPYTFRRWLQMMAPVFYRGIETQGLIEEYHHHYGKAQWGLKYSYKVNGMDFTKKLYSLPLKWRGEHYQKGDSIPVLYLKDNPQKSIPRIGIFEELFNFKGNN